MTLNIQYYHQDNNMHFYVFENGDGTKYTLHLTYAYYGGIYVICNESSVWRFHNDPDALEHLCGDFNEYTERAILQLADFVGLTE
tara:strand:- start:3189 stop:3443 length:255 start_codon:yes stop_codon:yes gene_type:complete